MKRVTKRGVSQEAGSTKRVLFILTNPMCNNKIMGGTYNFLLYCIVGLRIIININGDKLILRPTRKTVYPIGLTHYREEVLSSPAPSALTCALRLRQSTHHSSTHGSIACHDAVGASCSMYTTLPDAWEHQPTSTNGSAESCWTAEETVGEE